MVRSLFASAAILLITVFPALAGDAERLIGRWSCRTAQGIVPLEFSTRNRLVFNGDAASYALARGAIRVQEDHGPVDYRYRFSGKTLLVTFPDGGQISCTKAEASPPRRAAEREAAGHDGQEHLLQGGLCTWSGSRSGSSSYSRTGRVQFDGRGRFTYGSEGSYSGDAGIAAGRGPAAGGTYRVSGNKVHLTFGDGSSGTATVHFRQDNGRITELMYEGQLYGTALCE
jgi:hypothetical protein